MGMFDGKDALSNEGSTAAIAALTDSPVLLVVDCSGMARSAAAVVKGFQSFDPGVRICGVIANRVGSEGHYELVRGAIEQECGIPTFGYLEQDERLVLPERHLGLVPSIERGELRPFFELLAERVESGFQLDALLRDMGTVSRKVSEAGKPFLFAGEPATAVRAKIAVAKDEAFSFYYPRESGAALALWGGDHSLLPAEGRAGAGGCAGALHRGRLPGGVRGGAVPSGVGDGVDPPGDSKRHADAGGMRRLHVFDRGGRHWQRGELSHGGNHSGPSADAIKARGAGLSRHCRHGGQFPRHSRHSSTRT